MAMFALVPAKGERVYELAVCVAVFRVSGVCGCVQS